MVLAVRDGTVRGLEGRPAERFCLASMTAASSASRSARPARARAGILSRMRIIAGKRCSRPRYEIAHFKRELRSPRAHVVAGHKIPGRWGRRVARIIDAGQHRCFDLAKVTELVQDYGHRPTAVVEHCRNRCSAPPTVLP